MSLGNGSNANSLSIYTSGLPLGLKAETKDSSIPPLRFVSDDEVLNGIFSHSPSDPLSSGITFPCEFSHTIQAKNNDFRLLPIILASEADRQKSEECSHNVQLSHWERVNHTRRDTNANRPDEID